MKIKDLSKKFLRFVFVTLTIGFLSFASISEAQAVNFTVNNNGDTSDITAGDGICADTSGNCTLRAAIEEANALAGNDTIDFAAGLTNATITLTTGVQITISGTNGTLQINGLGADKLTIDGGAGSNRIFFTDNAAAVTIAGVTMQGGNGNSIGGQGGAIYANGGALVLNAVLVQNNIVSDRGGGIYYNGGANHRIINSAIANNSASQVGGGIYLSGGTLFVANTTISGNHATAGGSQGGGVFVGGTATFRNSTITNNTAASAAGGIQAGTVNLGNTIVAGNSASFYPEILNFGGTTSAGNNFIGDSMNDSSSTNSAITYQMSDIRDKNPMLDVLQTSPGAPTPTHALMTGSLAINAGDNAKAVDPFNNSALTTDQRIIAARIGGGTVDIGAYEVQGTTAAMVSVGGRVSTAKGRGITNVLMSLTGSSGQVKTTITDADGYYSFSEVEAGETYIITAIGKRYTFSQPSQVVNVSDDTTHINFVGSSERRLIVF